MSKPDSLNIEATQVGKAQKDFGNTAVIPADYEALFAEYPAMLELLKRLNSETGKLIRKEAYQACAKRLRMLKKQGGKKAIIFEDEYGMELFQDYATYMHRPRGINFVQQMLNSNRYPEGSMERSLLQGMAQAMFSIFMVKELVPPGGFIAWDTFSGKEFFVLDSRISKQDVISGLFGLRIFPFKTAWMHTGAAIPLTMADIPNAKALNKELSQNDQRDLNEGTIFIWRGLVAREKEEGEEG
ncbi:MAG: hypothetical protein JXB25_09730 [Deltaproteobacteria bacterium]|nr:hypothetical protein [Deltaproteobacteria bacterium]